jgi:hypothetical protein
LKNKQYLLIFSEITFVLLTLGTATASKIHIYSGDSIQTAINNANSSDKIIVHPGIYIENININKKLTIESFS